MLYFGFHLPTHGQYGYDEVLEISRAAEELNFDSIWVGDHFYLPKEFYEKTGGDPERPNKLDAWTLLSAIAAQTSRIRLGARVSPLPFYDPGRIAKIVATVDIISRGRVNFGVGAGWFKDEAISFGLWWGKHGERISRMLESLEIILRLWTEDKRITYNGRYYRVVEAPFWPKPVQKPYPPVWFGGSSDKILGVAAKYGSGLLPLSNMPVKDFRALALKVAEKTGCGGRKIVLAPSLTYPDALGENPSTWISRIEEYAEAGAGKIIVDFSMSNVPLNGIICFLKDFSRRVFPKYRHAK
ncbi:MAG: LLM class flavin-dependent oxidoreductase [Candidatus Bathyarchaeota archaeon]|nr:LLM class flavin-dependent oxidoreductase [Candidatus Bathyarchaeota archaeon]